MPKLVPKIFREKAVILRQQGYSLDEIANQLRVRKSTVWYWIKKVPLSPEALKILEAKKRNTGFKVGNTAWQKNTYYNNLKQWSNAEIDDLKTLYASGLSMKDVGSKFGRSWSSIASAMKRNNINRRTSSETNRIKFLKSPLSFIPKKDLSPEEELLKVAGLMLYWGEGAKKGHSVDFANSSKEMIKLYLAFIRKIYQVNPEKFRVYLYSYSTQNQKDLIDFWSKLTQIPKNQFTKPYIRSHSGQKHDKMEHGLVHVRYHDKRLLDMILKDIKTVSKYLT